MVLVGPYRLRLCVQADDEPGYSLIVWRCIDMGRVSIQVMGYCKKYDFCVFICTVTSIVTLAAVAGKPSALRGPGFESGWTLGLGVLFSSVNFARRAKCCELAFKYFADASVSLLLRAPRELVSGRLALEPKWFRLCLI